MLFPELLTLSRARKPTVLPEAQSFRLQNPPKASRVSSTVWWPSSDPARDLHPARAMVRTTTPDVYHGTEIGRTRSVGQKPAFVPVVLRFRCRSSQLQQMGHWFDQTRMVWSQVSDVGGMGVMVDGFNPKIPLTSFD